LRKRTIPYREASVAATFYEPAYQRLRLWHQGRFVNLLCFVHESQPALRHLLEEQGAQPSRTFSAKCFAEVWESPSSDAAEAVSAMQEREFDKEISKALGCLDGKFSAAAGTLRWSNFHNRSGQHQVICQLLQESQVKGGPFR